MMFQVTCRSGNVAKVSIISFNGKHGVSVVFERAQTDEDVADVDAKAREVLGDVDLVGRVDDVSPEEMGTLTRRHVGGGKG